MATPDLNIPIKVTGLDDFKRKMQETSSIAGTATRAVAVQVVKMNAEFLASRGAAGAATLAFGQFLGFLGPIALGITAISDAFKLMGYATDLAKRRIQEYSDIAAKAGTVSTDFYQRISKGAAGAKLSVDDLSAAFAKLNDATTDKLGGSDLQNRLDELQKAGNLAGNTGLASLASANDTEEKFRAIVGLIEQAMQKGERLAALDIAGRAFGPQVSNALKADAGYLDQMLQRADAISRSEIISQEDLGRAVELKERMEAAQKVLAEKWKPIQDDLATLGTNYEASWVSITETLAQAVGYATDLYKALHQVPDWFANNIGSASIWKSITEATTTPESRKAAEQAYGISSDPAEVGMVGANAKLTAALQNHGNVKRAMQDASTIQAAVRGDTSKNPAKEVAETADQYDRAIEAVEKHTAKLQADTQAVGLGASALETFRAKAQLLTAAQQAGIPITAEITAKIDALAKAAGQAGEGLAKAKAASDISFGRQTAFMSPEDLQIAEQLRTIYGNDVPRALNSSEAAAIRLNNALRGTADAFSSSLSGPLLDFETGAKSAGDAMKDFEQQFVRSLLSMANQALIIKPLLSGLGGLFGLGSGSAPVMSSGLGAGTGGLSFPMFADGGPVTGPGGPRDDRVLARLSHGEYVVNAHAAAKHRDLLERINRAPRFADGGLVGGSAGSGGSPAPMIAPSNVIAPQIAVTVQGTPGMSDQDHQRTGENIARSLEHQVRSMIANELRTQRRPGGVLR